MSEYRGLYAGPYLNPIRGDVFGLVQSIENFKIRALKKLSPVLHQGFSQQHFLKEVSDLNRYRLHILKEGMQISKIECPSIYSYSNFEKLLMLSTSPSDITSKRAWLENFNASAPDKKIINVDPFYVDRNLIRPAENLEGVIKTFAQRVKNYVYHQGKDEPAWFQFWYSSPVQALFFLPTPLKVPEPFKQNTVFMWDASK